MNFKTFISRFTPNFLKEFFEHAVSKVIVAVLFAALAWMVAAAKDNNSTLNFVGKTWVAKDGKTSLVCNTYTDIRLIGRQEGPVIIKLEPKQDLSSNHFEGLLYCEDHGGVVSRISLDLEPYNQIHLRTISNVQANYIIDEIFRISWPPSPDITLK